MRPTRRGKDALDQLYWRDEILQAMFWMQGEGLAEAVGSPLLAQFLAAGSATVGRHMRRLSEEGLLDRLPGRPSRYRLTEQGKREGGRRFHDEFAAMTRPAHGECAPGCFCHDPAHAGEPCPGHNHQEVSRSA